MGIFFIAVWWAALMYFDFRYRRLPNQLTLPGAAIINSWALLHQPWWIGGGVAWAGLYLLTAVLCGGIGGGDIKFALGLGTLMVSLGIESLLMAIVGSSLISVLLGGIILMCSRKKSPHSIPHGPSMIIASTCVFVVF